MGTPACQVLLRPEASAHQGRSLIFTSGPLPKGNLIFRFFSGSDHTARHNSSVVLCFKTPEKLLV